MYENKAIRKTKGGGRMQNSIDIDEGGTGGKSENESQPLVLGSIED